MNPRQLSAEFTEAVRDMSHAELRELKSTLSDFDMRKMGLFKCPCNPDGRCVNPASHGATDGLLLIAIERELLRT
ncbi:hypothetical protein LCGC14_1111620 [marine sediment metagenome]|uniref:Uncharacterized protein n=1 Tax=marine sediment metagenome TaxID=412755 RepID=A0A0F9MBA9_9ZZZZ